MKDNIRKFLEEIANKNMSYEDASSQAQKLLDETLRDEVIDAFEYNINNAWNREDYKKAIKERNIIDLIYICHGHESLVELIKNNFNNMDKILDILNDYLLELEKEEEDNASKED